MADVVVLDFDCTLASRHMYNSIRSLVYREKLPKQPEIEKWDVQSKNLLSKLATLNVEVAKLSSGEEKIAKSGTLFRTPCFSADIKGALSFSDWIMGGSNRILILNTLLNCAAKFHIATRGKVSEVKELLRNCNLLHFFTSIHGYDDGYEKMQTYNVETDETDNTDLNSKAAYILSLKPREGFKMYYVDDDTEEYKNFQTAIKTHENSRKERTVTTGKENEQKITVDCIHIGEKETVGAFTTEHMEKLKKTLGNYTLYDKATKHRTQITQRQLDELFDTEKKELLQEQVTAIKKDFEQVAKPEDSPKQKRSHGDYMMEKHVDFGKEHVALDYVVLFTRISNTNMIKDSVDKMLYYPLKKDQKSGYYFCISTKILVPDLVSYLEIRGPSKSKITDRYLNRTKNLHPYKPDSDVKPKTETTRW